MSFGLASFFRTGQVPVNESTLKRAVGKGAIEILNLKFEI
jgi:hypothetical protein